MSSRREFIQAGLAATGVMATSATPALAGASQAPGQRPEKAVAKTKGAKFRELLQGSEPFEAISAHDVQAARLSEMMGFRSLMLGSSSVSQFVGVPDWSIIGDADRIDFYGRIAQSVDI